jgi:hypothetical protein
MEPDEPPHAKQPTAALARATHPIESPGSTLEGLNIVFGRIAQIAAVEAAQAAEVEAARVAALPPVEVTPTPPTEELIPSEAAPSTGGSPWDYQADCETGGDWSMQGSMYSGGLGFLNSSWNAYGGQEFASNAGLATREQQIIVAERIQPSPPSYPGYCTGW